MLTFYTHPMSRGRTIRWMLEEVGQPYETVVLDYGTTMKAPAYLALNPMGKVPTVVHDGHVITEVAAIVTYLAEAFPEAGLQGTDRASFLRWMFFAAGPLEQAIVNRALGVEVSAKQSGFVGYGNYDRVVDTLDGVLSSGTWLAGDAFSAVDLYVGAHIGYALQFGSLPSCPSFTAYFDRMKDRPARQRATEKDNALMPKDPAHA